MSEGDYVRVNGLEGVMVGMISKVYQSHWWEVTYRDGSSKLEYVGHIELLEPVEAISEMLKEK